MSVPTYDSYRESGVEWLGEVPSHWAIAPLKRSIEFTTGWTPPTGRDEFYDGDQLWANISDLNGRYLEDTAKKITEAAVVAANIRPSPVGSLIFSFKLSIGQVAFARRDMFTNEAIATFLPSADVDLSFAYYAFPLFVVANAVENIYGAKLLNQELIRNATLALPPLAEQAAIAAFLDRETGKIDALVEAQTRLIELLKEKRQAVISHAVTKGLDPAASMKDSGVEWLGQVPAHWEVAPLKRYLELLSGYAFPSAGFSYDAADIRLLRGANIGVGRIRWDDVVYWPSQEALEQFSMRPGDIVLGMDRPWIADGLRIAQLSDEDAPCLLLQRVAALRPNDALRPNHLLKLLMSEAFYHHCAPDMTGVSVPHISPTQVGDFVVAIPPPAEQRDIELAVKTRTDKLAALMAKAEVTIALLQERRAALISAAITGKIDVSGLAPEQAEAA